MNSTEKAKKYQNKIQRVGVIGGGQLAWMMADAAKKLGVGNRKEQKQLYLSNLGNATYKIGSYKTLQINFVS
ncbi:hypothetical protein D5R40_35055 [Okeania hirsuta]|uniref:Uncharacterized protein n=1 Tax=Okeania hirsuta TaxID=1458930 RepID=A0A3N6PAB0_9CYAN|nr:hypothetical protein [Okeania hirsuta]RQH11343.1 hypothetical protein D5R40_35055 [Okeania hirsuta]